MKTTEKVDKKTGEITEGKLNQMVEVWTLRKDGSLRIQEDYSFCPSMTDQSQAQMTDVNYLIEKFKPDELGAYLAQKALQRREIIGHDFSTEPSLQEAKNIVYRSKQEFEGLDEEIRKNFRDHVDFLKFIDNPQNVDKMKKLGLLTQKQIDTLLAPVTPQATPPTTTKEEEKKEPKG